MYLIPRLILLAIALGCFGYLTRYAVVTRGFSKGSVLGLLALTCVVGAAVSHAVGGWIIADVQVAAVFSFLGDCVLFIFWKPNRGNTIGVVSHEAVMQTTPSVPQLEE